MGGTMHFYRTKANSNICTGLQASCYEKVFPRGGGNPSCS